MTALGVNGTTGVQGGSGGNLLAILDECENDHLLTIDTTSGHGGQGQDGGDGKIFLYLCLVCFYLKVVANSITKVNIYCEIFLKLLIISNYPKICTNFR